MQDHLPPSPRRDRLVLAVELGGNQRRSYELHEGDTIDAEAFQGLVRAAERNRAAVAERAAGKRR